MKAIYNVYLGGEVTRTTNILGVIELLEHYDGANIKEGKKAIIQKLHEGETVDIDGILSIA